MEEFRDIKGHEGSYQVSNLGRVKSLARMITESNGKKRPLNSRVLKASVNKRGYYQVGLTKDGKTKSRTIHQLVAESFLNHKPFGFKLVVNHIDHNKLNNKLDNLELITSRQNTNKKHIKSSSDYVGVCWHKNKKKWQAQIFIKDKTKYLGYFTDELEASKAYEKALNEII
tara:strand:+ start:86 stop:598 length:513 start_codon:yes stop_codon:yes gene_type:complete